MDDLIETAIERTRRFGRWRFANETEFKHELFHSLALEKLGGVPLSERGPDALTPRLHAEGKVENGNPAKADLLLCNPYDFQGFNYKVEHIFELKVALNKRELEKELQKIATYRGRFQGIWLAASSSVSLPVDSLLTSHPKAESIRIIGLQSNAAIASHHKTNEGGVSLSSAHEMAASCINECLTLYGTGKKQYRSHFWCNFEHELERCHSYPCEGDFNAQLYHRLRLKLPASVRIHSEYRPKTLSSRRLDLLLEDLHGNWAIPIEVKMNWDQFKPKYKDRVAIRSEALTILDRFSAVREEYGSIAPVLVVIQGDWRRETKMQNMENAHRDLDLASFRLNLMCYHELRNEIGHYTIGDSRG